MLTDREKSALAAVAGTCALWLLVAGLVALYAFAQDRDAQDDQAARTALEAR